MNFAFTSLIIFLVLLPGLSANRLYYSGEFSKEYIKSTPWETLFQSIVPGLFFHLIAICAIDYFNTPFKVDTDAIATLITGISDPLRINEAFKAIESNVVNIIVYNFIICIIAAFFGLTAKVLVRYFKIDRRFKIFRFQNHWHYIVTGELLDFSDRKGTRSGKREKVELVYIDALVELNEGTVIYKGILVLC